MMLSDIIVKSASVVLPNIAADGSMPAGHNGPYFDKETPVRNTAHWSLVFLKAFKHTGDHRFQKAARSCLEYLMSDGVRPMHATFWHRMNPEKDLANGLVGQAWTIEALLELSLHFQEAAAANLAREVFLLHPFDSEVGAWRRVNVDGSYFTFDDTLNHQLWFAAAGGLLSKSLDCQEIRRSVVLFLNKLEEHLSLYPDGLIRHKYFTFLAPNLKKKSYNLMRQITQSGKAGTYMRMKSAGYHGFNLYALALLKQCFPDHPFWLSKKMLKTLRFASSTRFKTEVAKSKYGFPYNPTGFEIAFAFQEFDVTSEAEIEQWVSWQINTCFDFNYNLMIGGKSEDCNTSAARLYEATRLKDYKVEVTNG